MKRATMQQRTERMNAAHQLLQRHPPAEAARRLAERYALSSGQARRYVRATTEDSSLAQATIKDPITVRIPRPLLEQLRERARITGRSLGSVVAQAIANFLGKTSG